MMNWAVIVSMVSLAVVFGVVGSALLEDWL